ncbi:uncharacterized protein K460DRAFT_77406 [Cucurbitaria berberidis CBS 394.84]|uniref:Uncharacterized protein n=1 Tax=Cucurbitaria berberidis CBS 394.84 TaxID=1168544 RepID=A0A9P4GP39_9PLEO|nr:uncharacterized protein K460DRAFT_77406 [Cucurbitaria berberidis CBS 394.84]KAF1848576.1 hypothetical protein K460DRAFT_77406 [Cucurbitaria berberidis CBS 394.84]
MYLCIHMPAIHAQTPVTTFHHSSRCQRLRASSARSTLCCSFFTRENELLPSGETCQRCARRVRPTPKPTSIRSMLNPCSTAGRAFVATAPLFLQQTAPLRESIGFSLLMLALHFVVVKSCPPTVLPSSTHVQLLSSIAVLVQVVYAIQ